MRLQAILELFQEIQEIWLLYYILRLIKSRLNDHWLIKFLLKIGTKWEIERVNICVTLNKLEETWNVDEGFW